MRTWNQILSLILIGVAASACGSPGREAAWEREQAVQRGRTGTSTSATSALIQQAEESWAKRDDKAQVEKTIELLEQAAAQDPTNAQALVWLSRAYYFLVDGHLAVEAPENIDDLKLELHQKGVDWGERALLILDPEFEKTMRGGGEFEDAIGKISAPAVPAAYWYCTNLGRFAVAKGLSAKLFYKDRVAAAMKRIRELDQKFFYAGADRYFGAFYSALPSIAGKDVDKSKEHFKIALELAPEYLPNKVVKAEFLAVELDDRAMYDSLLKEVLAGADTDNPDIAPENRAAKRTAKKMLAKADDIF